MLLQHLHVIIFTITTITYSLSANTIPLYQSFPHAKKTIPHTTLGSFPTPIEHVMGISKSIDVQKMYIKRDTECCTSSYSYAYKSNIIRSLEFIVPFLQQQNHTPLIIQDTDDALHMPHILYALNACKIPVQNNLQSQTLQKQSLKNKNKSIFPAQANHPRAALGFFNAALELQQQTQKKGTSIPDYLYISHTSPAALAGLAVGIRSTKLPTTIIAVAQTENHCELMQNLVEHINNFEFLLSLLDRNQSCLPDLSQLTSPQKIQQFLKKKYHLEVECSFTNELCKKLPQEVQELMELFIQKTNISPYDTPDYATLGALCFNAYRKKHTKNTILFWESLYNKNLKQEDHTKK
ncbi:MAG: hypothetical protein US69_C0014G0005 [candidate division TM6 bacterium GW2011_GWF2_38_10]|nr:MAG: hypothetical protein US69_C0014G0005 [candidate division TM6 bacterium GW2011_GWF2_38_10]